MSSDVNESRSLMQEGEPEQRSPSSFSSVPTLKTDAPTASLTLMERLIMFSLFFLFGLAPWLTINGLFVELPILINELPEGYNIATYLSVTIQISNVVAVLYVLAQHRFPSSRLCHPYFVVLILLIVSVITPLLISLLWKISISNFSAWPLLLLCFVSGAVGCSSVVVFYPFAARFSHHYPFVITAVSSGARFSHHYPFVITAVSSGGACNAIVTSLLGALQQPGARDQQFSIQIYFFLLSFICLLSLFSFLVICFWSRLQIDNRNQNNNSQSKFNNEKHSEIQPIVSDENSVNNSSKTNSNNNSTSPSLIQFLYSLRFYLLNQFVICTLNYMLIGLGVYAFKNLPNQDFYIRWMNISSLLLGAITRLFTALYLFPSPTLLTLLQSPLFAFMIWFAFMPPAWKSSQPTFVCVLLLIANGVQSAVYGYEDTLIFLLAARENRSPPSSAEEEKVINHQNASEGISISHDDDNANNNSNDNSRSGVSFVSRKVTISKTEQATKWVGLANQAGAFVGSALMLLFLLLNIVP